MKSPQPAVHQLAGLAGTAARLIAVGDLPVARTDIELSTPPSRLELADAVPDARKILALVRLHTHPLGNRTV
jgi:hypothetical protein